jgi:SAM-dependent methyltransferase
MRTREIAVKEEPKAHIDWNQFNTWNRRDVAMSTFWSKPLVNWTIAFIERQNVKSCLDYGCGYFDLGRALIPYLERIDGYDPHAPSVRLARDQLHPSTQNASLYADIERLMSNSYDLIVASSVIQYFHGQSELEAFFQRTHRLLRPNGYLLIADIISPKFSPLRDGLNSLKLSLAHGFFVPMIVHLAKSLKVKNQGLRKYSEQDLFNAAADCGLIMERLPRNLTPSRERYTCLFYKRSSTEPV